MHTAEFTSNERSRKESYNNTPCIGFDFSSLLCSWLKVQLELSQPVSSGSCKPNQHVEKVVMLLTSMTASRYTWDDIHVSLSHSGTGSRRGQILYLPSKVLMSLIFWC